MRIDDFRKVTTNFTFVVCSLTHRNCNLMVQSNNHQSFSRMIFRLFCLLAIETKTKEQKKNNKNGFSGFVFFSLRFGFLCD